MGDQTLTGEGNQGNDAVKTAAGAKASIWTGRILTALMGLFMLMDGVMKLVKPKPVVEATVRMGFSESTLIPIGIVLVLCTILYLIPCTAVLGAILLTGYLGGAVATQVRAGAPLFETFFPVLFGVLVWAGIFLQDGRLRALVPLRSKLAGAGNRGS